MCFLPVSSAPAQPAPPKWHGWWELGGYYGTDDSNRGEIVLFQPLGQTATSIFFADVRGKLFENDVQEGNFALGHRRMLNSGWNFGFWGGIDVRSSQTDNKFWQASGGLEALSDRWDVRVNGYAPITDPKSSPSTARVFLAGNNIFMVGGEEVPLYGVDVEVGFKLFGGRGRGGAKDGPSYGRRTELRVYGGGFYFDDENAFEEVAGLKTRIEFRIEDIIPAMPGSRLTLESEYSYDDVRDHKWELGARLRIPFGGSAKRSRASAYAALSPQARRMTEGLERDTDIVTGESEEENVIDNATNVAMNQVAFANSAASLITGVATGPNTLILVQGPGAQIDVSATSGQALQASQTIQGGASTIQMRGSRTGIVAAFTAPGARPTLFSNDANATTGVITVASNTHVAGLNIQGSGGINSLGNNGIFGGDNLTNVFIEQNAISNMGRYGVVFGDTNSNVSVWGNAISDPSRSGVEFNDNNSNVTVSGNTISNAGLDGVHFFDNNTNVTLWGNTISDTNTTAVQFNLNNTNVTVSDNTISDPGSHGVSVSTNNTNITVSGNTISDAGARVIGQGIRFAVNNANVTVSGNTILRGRNTGVVFNTNNTNVTVSDNDISNTGDQSVVFLNNNQFVSVTGNTISGSGNTGLDDSVRFSDNNSNVSVLDNTISNAGFTGVSFRNNNSNVTVSGNNITDAAFDGVTFIGSNTGLLLSGNNFSQIGDDVFSFSSGANTLLAPSTGNTTADAPGGAICAGAGNFTGTLEVTDQNGALQTFTNGC